MLKNKKVENMIPGKVILGKRGNFTNNNKKKRPTKSIPLEKYKKTMQP